MDELIVRALALAEWDAFRNLRLAALKDAPGAFATSYADAVKRAPETWQSLVSGPANQIFGLFDGAQLVGITGAFAWPDDASEETATLVMSYIVPAYRGRCLSGLLYTAALDWIRAHPRFKRVIVAMRASNTASRRACERHGFAAIQKALRNWPDATLEDEVVYELRL
ncbi:MAG: GNAT family N-acetyltransferase [Xanthobacteraceae bacterium]|nr:GNAT family N-acetyltransferase [Xanthobacteraceae bacterium]